MTLIAQRYDRCGLLAINPEALNKTVIVDDAKTVERVNVEMGDAVIVDIRGPLEAHLHPCFDSYEAIQQRVAAACATGCRAVILRFDSPGGDVKQCFDTAVALRACADAAGKQLHAYAEGECASAAYALASQCQSLTISLSSVVGSIGILSMRQDLSVANAARGLRVALVMSGARKGDGHAEMPISDAELASAQTIVDSMADVFFDLVSRGRGMKPAAVAALQARTFHGEAAVRAGLADAVGPLTTVLARVASGGTVMAKAKMSYEEMREALSAASEGDDPNAAACRRALKALSAEDGDGAEPKKEEKKDDDAPPAAASGAGATSAEDEEKARRAEAEEQARRAEAEEAARSAEGGQSAAAAYKLALKAQSDNAKLRAELAERDERAERAELIASRPDLGDDMVSVLRKAPIALVREHIASMPALKMPAAGGGIANPRVSATGKPTVGKDAPNGASLLPAAEKAWLDARMGLQTQQPGVVSSDFKLELGAYKTSA